MISVKQASKGVNFCNLFRHNKSDNCQCLHEGITEFTCSNSAVLLNSQLGELFKTTVGVSQGCLLSTVLFNMVTVHQTVEKNQTYILYFKNFLYCPPPPPPPKKKKKKDGKVPDKKKGGGS